MRMYRIRASQSWVKMPPEGQGQVIDISCSHVNRHVRTSIRRTDPSAASELIADGPKREAPPGLEIRRCILSKCTKHAYQRRLCFEIALPVDFEFLLYQTGDTRLGTPIELRYVQHPNWSVREKGDIDFPDDSSREHCCSMIRSMFWIRCGSR